MSINSAVTYDDEYNEVYCRFMEEYDSGKSIEDITKEILSSYYSEFDEKDEILYDVYYALAKAQWRCGELSNKLLEKVRDIIESGKDLAFVKELGADESFLKARSKSLSRFLAGISVPVKKPRKRTPPKEFIPRPMPPMEVGDCFAYKHENGKRVVVILDMGESKVLGQMVFACVLKNTFENFEIDFLNENIGSISFYYGNTFIAKSRIKKVAHLQMPVDMKTQIFGNGIISAFGSKRDFFADFSDKPDLTLNKLLETRLVKGPAENEVVYSDGKITFIK